MILVWLIAVLAALPLAGLIYQWLGERRDRRRFPPPGRLIEGRFHVHESGEGSPAVILEAGIAASSLSWRLVQRELERFTRVASYDRLGFGWSSVGATPRRLPVLVEDLHEMLMATGLPGPFVFVGHSFGGLLLRHFTARYPEMVRGLVLLDPLDPIEWHPIGQQQAHRLSKGVMLSRRGGTLARFGVVRLALDLLMSGSRRLPQFLNRVSSGRGSFVADRLVGEVRKMPPEVWPAVRAHWCLPRSFITLAEYLERLPENCAIPTDDGALAGIPLIVISSDKSTPEVIEAHRRTAALSKSSIHEVAENCGHWIQLDRPDLVVEAVRRLL